MQITHLQQHKAGSSVLHFACFLQLAHILWCQSFNTEHFTSEKRKKKKDAPVDGVCISVPFVEPYLS